MVSGCPSGADHATRSAFRTRIRWPIHHIIVRARRERTTLANPEVLDDIRHDVQDEKAARGEVLRELSIQEVEEIKAFGQAEERLW